MIMNFPYNINIGSVEMIDSSVFYKLSDSEYQKLINAYKKNSYPLFISECEELKELESKLRDSIYNENAAIYLANKDIIHKIIDDADLALNESDKDLILKSYSEIFDCDILFPDEVLSIFKIK